MEAHRGWRMVSTLLVMSSLVMVLLLVVVMLLLHVVTTTASLAGARPWAANSHTSTARLTVLA